MDLKLMAVIFGLFTIANTVGAIETADIEEISMQVIDENIENTSEFRMLSLPDTAAMKAQKRASQHGGFDLSKANEMRTKHDSDSESEAVEEKTIEKMAARQDKAPPQGFMDHANERAVEAKAAADEKRMAGLAHKDEAHGNAEETSANGNEHASTAKLMAEEKRAEAQTHADEVRGNVDDSKVAGQDRASEAKQMAEEKRNTAMENKDEVESNADDNAADGHERAEQGKGHGKTP